MMKIRIVLFVSAIIAVFCFFQFWYPYHFFYHEQNQIFLWEWEYVSGYFQKSGGLASLTGDFLTQFYYYLYAGATILTNPDGTSTSYLRLYHDQGGVPDYYSTQVYASLITSEILADSACISINTYKGIVTKAFQIKKE